MVGKRCKDVNPHIKINCEVIGFGIYETKKIGEKIKSTFKLTK